jgi:hypothetical protein
MSRGRFTIAIAGAIAGLAIAGSAAAAGVTGPAFYVDGELYRTVGTPTNFEGTGAPDSSFDTIYAFIEGEQRNVAEAAPGDPDFNGGRWIVQGLSFTDYDAAVAMYDTNMSGDFDSAEEVEAAIAGGAATTMELTRFECPVIPVPKGHS